MAQELTFAVVVTVKNDAPALARLLAMLERQTLLPTEVILVIAKSEDRSLQVAGEWQPRGITVRVLDVPAQTTRSRARNLGVQASQSDVFVFTDAGCLPDQHWLKELTKPLKKKAELVSGLTIPEIHSAWDEAQARFVLVPPEDVSDHPHPATRNMALSRSLWNKGGGFREELNFGEDYELARRLWLLGARSVYVPTAIVLWQPRSTLQDFFFMIAKLTAGDVQSGHLRRGVATMWLRYSLILGVSLISTQLSFSLFILYLLLKQLRWKRLSAAARGWAFVLQVVADVAVLGGSILGLVWRWRRAENTTI